MGASGFSAGVHFVLEGKEHALIRKIDGDVWQAEERRTKRIVEFTDLHLRELYLDGRLKFVSSQSAPATTIGKPGLVDYSAEKWDKAKVRRAYVMAVIDLPNYRPRLIPIIQETWRTLQRPTTAPDVATVMRWKRKFIDSGRDITVLIEQDDQKGNSRARYPDDVIKIIKNAIEKRYLTRERGTVQDALDQARADVIRENALRPDSIALPQPTRRIVTRLIEAIPAFDRCTARHGRTAAIKRFRGVHAHRTTQAPLERAEMDHSLLDLMVIDDKTALPLGRPWLTGCIDDYTRCVLGIYLSFEPPSYFTVARCLKHAMLPKVHLRRDYADIRNPWEAHGIMRELVVDNGTEFHSTSLQNACFTLGIEIHYAARKTPWFKGKIERFLGTLNRAVTRGTPGTTFHNVFEKDEYDPSKHAVVRYSVLKEIVYTWVADVYHQQMHRALESSPAAMWGKSVAQDSIQLPDDPARLDAILGRSERRSLSHKGIELNGLFYNSSELTELRRRLGDKLDVEIRVDASDIGQIIVFSPDGRQMFSVSALNSEYAAGLSEWQHRICKRLAGKEQLQHSPEEGWLAAKTRIAELIEAEFMYKKQRSRTRIARYKGDAELLRGDAAESTADASNEQPTALVSMPVSATIGKRFKPVYRERKVADVESD